MAPAIPVNFLGQKEPKKFLALETMGKARKYSKGQSPRFVPDYRHAVENTVESEGFGYTGGMDTEMTLSDDSCAQKRKHISLNGDGRGVPKEVVPLSKLSRFERKDLICKLKIDLERVQDLHRKLASMNSDVVLVSPRSDIHSCSDGPRRLLPERSGRSVGKKRGALRTNMPRSKKGPSGRSQSVSTSFSLAQVMKQCEALLKSLISHQYGWPFHVPVDPVQLKIPDYFTIIKRPMDFGTIKTKLCKGEYSSPLDFVADVRLTLSNSMTYNPPGNEYHFMAQALSKYFETRWKSIEKKIPMVEPSIPPLNGTASAAVIQSKLKMEPANLVMTDEDKKKLRRELEALEEDIPENIADFLRQQSASAGQSGEEEIEIDIDDLSDEILFKLRGLLDDYMTEKKKSQEKSELCEMEIVHDLGLSNSPAQPSKGDGVIDEDVDIVSGNDPPVSIYPPLKMEKDASCRNNEGTSSSSSSSESGSSSSDSDSTSSSGSELDTVKASYPAGAKDKVEPGVAVNREENSGNNVEIVNHPLDESGQVEQELDDKPTAIDADGPRDEETAPSERQISPERLYRAALLKNRFADTILKAREKALDKGEKGDPEKLRIEREEFERRLREEKARLQAEAKAAEEAKRKADAEAAATARRKREQEREAARQALQNMEKTVDINENSQFLEDLEMLRAVAEGDKLPCFMEETSPEFSENMLGSFKMQGNNNPLEQLGLYMKMDEDEDEEEDEQPVEQSEGEMQSLRLNREDEDDQSLSGSGGDGQPLNQNKADEQSLNCEGEEGDAQSLSRSGEDQPLNQIKADEHPVEQNEGDMQSLAHNQEEEDEHFLSRSEESQSLNQSKADEGPVEQNEGERHSHVHPVSGSEVGQPITQKERDEKPLDESQGAEQVQDRNEGDEQLESSTPKQENDDGAVDKGEIGGID